MLYFNTSYGQHVVILEPESLETLKTGEFVKSPNKVVLIGYTPDAEWLGEKIMENMDNLTPELLDRLISESQQRPEKRGRAYHPTMHVIKDGKVQGGKS
jgi:hypothetical protein